MSLRLHYTLDLLILLCIFIIIYVLKVRQRESWYKLIFCLSFLYLSLVIFVTLMPFQPIRLTGWQQLGRYNLIPFADISLRHLGAKREAVLNVFMFMPMGFLLPELRKRDFFKTLLLSFLASLTVESIQLLYGLSGTLYGRSFDVTDLITNTCGAALGYLIWLLLRPLTRLVKAKMQ